MVGEIAAWCKQEVAIMLRGRPARRATAALFARALKVAAVDLRRSMVVSGSELGQPADRLLSVEEFTKGKAGKGGGYVQVTLRDLASSSKFTHKFNSADRVETVELEGPFPHTVLYQEDGVIHLMEEVSYETIELPASMVDPQQLRWVHDGMSLKVSTYEGAPRLVQLPAKATFEVTEASNTKAGELLKFVTLENGERTRVPQYIEAGERVAVYTEDGTFASRVSGER